MGGCWWGAKEAVPTRLPMCCPHAHTPKCITLTRVVCAPLSLHTPHPTQAQPLDQAAGSGSPQATFKRAGVLQQALLLELPSGNFNRVQVVLEGHEGQLPKLDMYWIYR